MDISAKRQKTGLYTAVPGAPPALGSAWVDGVRRSLRNNPGLAAGIEEITDDAATALTDAQLNAIAEEIKTAGLDITKPIEDEDSDLGGGRRRRKQRGGDKAAIIENLKTIAKAIAEYLKKETGPIGTSTTALAVSVVRLGQETVVRVPVSVVTLILSGGTLTANFFSSLFGEFNQWARTTATKFEDPNTAEGAAIAAVKDLPSIATTVGISVVALNQIGVLPLSAVLAAILYMLRVNLGTGPGRGLMLTQFYAWYNIQDKKDQEALKKEATKYATLTTESARELAKIILRAPKQGKNLVETMVEMADKAKLTVDPNIRNKIKEMTEAAATAELEDETTAAVAAEAAARSGGLVGIVASRASSSSSSSSPVSASPAAVGALGAEPLVEPSVSSNRRLWSQTLAKSAQLSAKADEGRVLGKKQKRPEGEGSQETTPTPSPVSMPTRRSAAAANASKPLESPGTRVKKNKGGRKTYRKKPKRRATRRAKKVAMPVFNY